MTLDIATTADSPTMIIRSTKKRLMITARPSGWIPSIAWLYLNRAVSYYHLGAYDRAIGDDTVAIQRQLLNAEASPTKNKEDLIARKTILPKRTVSGGPANSQNRKGGSQQNGAKLRAVWDVVPRVLLARSLAKLARCRCEPSAPVPDDAIVAGHEVPGEAPSLRDFSKQALARQEKRA